MPPKSGLPGYCHFPAGYDKKHYDGLMSEDRRPETTRYGRTRMTWHQHGRNEPLDARVYALAGLYVFHELLSDALREEYHLYDENEQPRKLTWAEFWTLLENAPGEMLWHTRCNILNATLPGCMIKTIAGGM